MASASRGPPEWRPARSVASSAARARARPASTSPRSPSTRGDDDVSERCRRVTAALGGDLLCLEAEGQRAVPVAALPFRVGEAEERSADAGIADRAAQGNEWLELLARRGVLAAIGEHLSVQLGRPVDGQSHRGFERFGALHQRVRERAASTDLDVAERRKRVGEHLVVVSLLGQRDRFSRDLGCPVVAGARIPFPRREPDEDGSPESGIRRGLGRCFAKEGEPRSELLPAREHPELEQCLGPFVTRTGARERLLEQLSCGRVVSGRELQAGGLEPPAVQACAVRFGRQQDRLGRELGGRRNRTARFCGRDCLVEGRRNPLVRLVRGECEMACALLAVDCDLGQPSRAPHAAARAGRSRSGPTRAADG